MRFLPALLLLLPLLLAAPAWPQTAGEPCANSDGGVTTQAGHDPGTGEANDLLACIGGAWKSIVGVTGDGSCAPGQVGIVAWSGDGSQKIRQVSCKSIPDCAAAHQVLRFNGADFWCDSLANAYTIPTCQNSEVLEFNGITFMCSPKHDSCALFSRTISHGTRIPVDDCGGVSAVYVCVDGVLIEQRQSTNICLGGTGSN